MTNSPVKSMYSQYNLGNPNTHPEFWHSTLQSSDEYMVMTFDGGDNWGNITKVVGSDATIPTYITETILSKGVIEAPRINANAFGIYPASPSASGSLSLYGDYGGVQYEVFKLGYYAGDSPNVIFSSPRGAIGYWNFGTSYFTGSVNFGGATVTGITAKFG